MSSSDASANLHTHAKFAVQYKQRIGKALEDRTLILTSYSFHVQYIQGVAPKTIVRTEFTIPFIDICSIENVNPEEITFNLADQRHFNYVAPPGDIVGIITHVMTSMSNHFPEVDIEERLIALKVSDPDRLSAIRNAMQTRRARLEGSPCGSFRETYDYFCKYFNSPKRDEIVWDIETVYHTQNNKTLCLRDFDHVDAKDLLPMIAAVSFSSWFAAVDASGIRLTLEAQAQILNVLKRNKLLQGLSLDGCFLRNDFFSKMPSHVDFTGCSLRHLDLSNNPVGDVGLVALCGLFTKLRLTLERLVLANCGMTARGANRLAEAFAGSQRDVKPPLSQLNLSGNSLKGEELSQFYNFLANQNSIAELDLSKTDCCIDALSVALLRGCTQHLRVLRLSGNPFFGRAKASSVHDSWRQFFATTISLEHLSIASCKLPLEALRLLLTGLSENRALTDLALDLSSNELRTGGAADVLLSFLSKLPMLSSLDLSDNEMNTDMMKVIEALSASHHVRHLKIGANYGALKARQIIEMMEKLTRYIQSPESCIESLSLADSKLRGDLTILLNELSSNPSLVTLDISGNLMGDVGLRILSRILVLNTHLRELSWDRNCLSLQSLEEVAKALEHNHTLQFLRLPASDLGPLMQRNPEKTAALLAKIESALAKNHGLRRVSTDRAFKMQQGFVSTSSHELIDKLIVQLDSRCSRLLSSKDEDHYEEVKAAVAEARAAISDAQAAKRLLASLQADALAQEETKDSPLFKSVGRLPGELQAVMTEQIRLSVSRMLTVARDQCSFVKNDEGLCESLQSECLTKCQLPPRFLETLVQTTLSTGLSNKAAELDVGAAAHISDRVLDEAIKRLDEQHRSVHRFVANLVTMRRRRKLAAESVASVNSGSDEAEEDNFLAEMSHLPKTETSKRSCRPRSTFAVVDPPDPEIEHAEDSEAAEDHKQKEERKGAARAAEKAREEQKAVRDKDEHPEEEEVKREAKKEKKEKLEEKKRPAPSPPTSSPPTMRPASLGDHQQPSVKPRTNTLPSSLKLPSPQLPHSSPETKLEEAKKSMSSGANSMEDLLGGSSATSHSGASKSQDSLDSAGALSPFSESPGPSPASTHRQLSHLQLSRPRRARTHRPTKAIPDTVAGSSGDLFAATQAVGEVTAESEEEVKVSAGGDRKEQDGSVKENMDDKKNRPAKGIAKNLKSLKDKLRKSPAKEPPKPEAKPEAKPEPKSEPKPEEEPAPARVPRLPVGAVPTFSLADITKRREDLRSGAMEPQNPSAPAPRLPSPKGPPPSLPQGKPDTPSSPKPKPNFQIPALRPVQVRDKEPKSAAQTEADREKRLSVRERIANLSPNASPPAPPPKPRKPASLRVSQEVKPPPPEKPQE